MPAQVDRDQQDQARVSRFKVKGLDCQNEVRALKAAVGPLVGGEERLSFDTKVGRMDVASQSLASAEAIREAVASTGMVAELWSDDSHTTAISQTPANTPCTSCASDALTLPERVGVSEQVVFKVHGMDCGDEVAALKREVGPVVGGEDKLVFDLVNGRMSVQGRAGGLPVEQIEKAVRRTGMMAELWQEGATSDATIADERRRRTQTLLTTASGILAAAGLGYTCPSAVASAQPRRPAVHLCWPLQPTLSRFFVPFATWLPKPCYRRDVCGLT